jgi:hypothetical protein
MPLSRVGPAQLFDFALERSVKRIDRELSDRLTAGSKFKGLTPVQGSGFKGLMLVPTVPVVQPLRSVQDVPEGSSRFKALTLFKVQGSAFKGGSRRRGDFHLSRIPETSKGNLLPGSLTFSPSLAYTRPASLVGRFGWGS